MLRKCLRCETEMREGYALFASSGYWRVVAAEDRKWYPKEIGKLHCAVCPECGYTELYAETSPQGENL